MAHRWQLRRGGLVVALLVCGTVGTLMLVKAVRRGRIVPPPWKRKG